ncbi:MAG: PEP-CTERM sorting domain-containing protein [Planctomycetota bacterium]
MVTRLAFASALVACTAATGLTHAAILGDFNETFANTDGVSPNGDAIGGIYSVGTDGVAANTFTFDTGDNDDLDLLGDGDDDGYGALVSVGATASQNVILTVDLGTIDLSDVGSEVTMSIAIGEIVTGATTNFDLQVNGSTVTAATQSLNTFGGNPNNGVLTQTYTIQPGDVGGAFTADIRFFDSGSSDRGIIVDTIDYSVVVPEPATLALAGLGLASCLPGRRRS